MDAINFTPCRGLQAWSMEELQLSTKPNCKLAGIVHHENHNVMSRPVLKLISYNVAQCPTHSLKLEIMLCNVQHSVVHMFHDP